jgi:hypothetical protein
MDMGGLLDAAWLELAARLRGCAGDWRLETRVLAGDGAA